MSEAAQPPEIDFSVDKNHLYREESFTDLKVASIRRLVPIHSDGSEDKSRTSVFVGHTQLMSPEGPVPIQSKLEANNLDEALEIFPKAMEDALAEVVERLQQMHRQQQQKEQNDSRIIVPGR